MPPGKNQDRIKDYNDLRITHTDMEHVAGYKDPQPITKSHPDTYAILEEIRKTPIDPKEHPRRVLRRGLPKGKK